MTLEIAIPDLVELQLQHLLLAVNGTLINRASLLSGVDTRLIALRAKLTIHLVSADTFGTLEQISKLLQASAVRARPGEDDLRELERLGPELSAVIGNDAKDALALQAAALGMAVIGHEWASPSALRAADVACTSLVDALDLLLEPRALSATLRP